MSQLDPDKLHIKLLRPVPSLNLESLRRYTLTHSDLTGELFLSIGADFDRKAISGWYTRLMRDEVLAEWIVDERGPTLHVYCHVSGGFVFGAPEWRYNILQFHMPQVLQAFRYGDSALYVALPELDQAAVKVHFSASQVQYHKLESWGMMGDYRLEEVAHREGLA